MWTFAIPWECVLGVITGWNNGPESILSLILMVSEASENQLKVFLGLVWPIPDSISMVRWLGGHLNPCSTLEMCFGMYNSENLGSKSLNLFSFLLSFTSAPRSNYRSFQGHQRSSTTYWKRLGACALCFKTSLIFVYTLFQIQASQQLLAIICW